MSATLISTTFETARKTATVTTRDDAISLKNVPDGTEIEVKGWVVQEITNETTGEVFNSVMVLSADGNVYATRSETFMRKLDEIKSIVGELGADEEPLVIRIAHGQSKSGNKFATCSLC